MKALLLLAIALCGVIPSRLVAAALPVIWVLQRLLPPELTALVRVGPVELAPSDLVIFVLFARLLVGLVRQRELAVDRPLYLALGVYLAVNLIATFVAGIKFGEPQLMRCATSWARFIFELLVLPIIAQTVRTLPEARLFLRVLLATLLGLAVIQFVNYFGAGHGFIIGEVQGIERGEERYFGPVGDSVGVILLLGYLAALCFANFLGAALFLGGILLTAGIGAIFAVVVGTGLFFFFGLRTEAVRDFARRMLWLLPMIALAALLAATFFARPMMHTLFDRLGTGNYSNSGAQRAVSGKLAVAMIVDNPLLGVGYMGYEQALPHYHGDRYFDLAKPDGATANANNQLLQALTDGGLFGLAAFFAFVVAAVRLLLRLATQSEDRFLKTFFLASFLWLLAQVFGNLAAVWLNPSSFVARFLWVVLGVAVAVARIHMAPGARPAMSETDSEKARLVTA
jgi:O-antigen ligase